MNTLSIPDMNCGHCTASMQDALAAPSGATGITVDLSTRSAHVAGHTPPEVLLAALDRIGSPAAVLA